MTNHAGSDFIVNLAASFAHSLLVAGGQYLRRQQFGDAEQRALQEVTAGAFEDTLTALAPDLPPEQQDLLRDIFGDFLAHDTVSAELLECALEGKRLPIDRFGETFDALGYEGDRLGIDFDLAMTTLAAHLSRRLTAEAKSDQSPLHHRVNITKQELLQSDLKEVLEALAAQSQQIDHLASSLAGQSETADHVSPGQAAPSGREVRGEDDGDPSPGLAGDQDAYPFLDSEQLRQLHDSWSRHPQDRQTSAEMAAIRQELSQRGEAIPNEMVRKVAAGQVMLVVATRLEYDAVLDLVEREIDQEVEVKHRGDLTICRLGEIEGAKVDLVRTGIGTGGLLGSQRTVTKAIHLLQPQAIIMLGIAFGARPDEQRIGDVLLSQNIMDYDLQRVSTGPGGESVITLRGDRVTVPLRMWQRFETGVRSFDKAEVHLGLILSGDKLVDNMDYRRQLQSLAVEAIGGEMEAGGLYVAAQDQNVDWIVVKGIADWADGLKHVDKQARQQTAAHNAAEFVWHVLQRGGFAG